MCWLLLDGPPALDGRVASFKLAGVQISGTLDLAGGTVEPYVERRLPVREGDPPAGGPLHDGTAGELLGAAAGGRPGAHRGRSAPPRCRFHNGVRLTDAQIGTDLLLNQAIVYRDRRGRSIAADGMSVGQDLQAEMLESHGELSLRGAKIGVSLSLRGAGWSTRTHGSP